MSGAGNVISGNTGDGVEISGWEQRAMWSRHGIGPNITGTVAIANGNDGVEIDNGASSNTIGGATAQARNLITGAPIQNSAVLIQGTSTSSNRA